MYVIVKEKTNNHVKLVWECQTFELTETQLITQGNDGVQTFSNFNNIDHIAEEYLSVLNGGFDPTTYSFENGVFTQLP